MILMMISALLTSIAIAREKEDGTLEQILVSPIKAHEIIIGKVIPYIGLAFLDGLMIIDRSFHSGEVSSPRRSCVRLMQVRSAAVAKDRRERRALGLVDTPKEGVLG